MDYQFIGKNRGGYTDVDGSELRKIPAEVRRIDVRQPEEFHGELGHVEGAELVPLGLLPGACEAWNKRAPILVICRSGNRSSQAARTLAASGFTNVGNLVGGMLALSGR
jgi:rhodanese-related sulfurtransferase